MFAHGSQKKLCWSVLKVVLVSLLSGVVEGLLPDYIEFSLKAWILIDF